MSIRSCTADEVSVTTPGTTDALVAEDEPTTVETAYAAALDALSRLHDDAMASIAVLAGTGATSEPDGEVRVLRMAELPTVTQRVDAAA